MVWNVAKGGTSAGGFGGEGGGTRESVLRVIQDHDPDVVVLVESQNSQSEYGGTYLGSWLASQLSLASTYGAWNNVGPDCGRNVDILLKPGIDFVKKYTSSSNYRRCAADLRDTRVELVTTSDELNSVCQILNTGGSRCGDFGLVSAHLDHTYYLPYQTADPNGYYLSPRDDSTLIAYEKGDIVAPGYSPPGCSPPGCEACPRWQQTKDLVGYVLSGGWESRRKPVLIGGDWNTPSHLDWTRLMAAEYSHIQDLPNLPVSHELEDRGFIDTYREVNPDPVSSPGFTWTTLDLDKRSFKGNPNEPFDRIDRLYRRSTTTGLDLLPKRAFVVPADVDNMPDNFGAFPSDHAAVIVDFEWIIN